MPVSQFPLAQIQRWMQAVIEHPADIATAVGSAPAQRAISARKLEALVLPSKTLAPLARIGIYHGMYFLRLRDALRTDYPATAFLLGESDFDRAVREYIQRHPSVSYTLNRLGDHFPAYLRRARWCSRATFAAEVARFELLMTQVFDEQERGAVTETDIRAVRPEQWAEACLRAIPALRLARFEWPLADWIDAARSGRKRRMPPKRPAHYAIFRRGYRVRRLDLAPAAADLLARLIKGARLGAAVTATLRRHPGNDAKLFAWFRDWTQAGLFASVEVAADAAAVAADPPTAGRKATRKPSKANGI